jgi:hypothetical protein
MVFDPFFCGLQVACSRMLFLCSWLPVLIVGGFEGSRVRKLEDSKVRGFEGMKGVRYQAMGLRHQAFGIRKAPVV